MSLRRSSLVALTALAMAAAPVVPTVQSALEELPSLPGACAPDLASASALVTDQLAPTPQRRVVAGTEVAVVADPLVAPPVPRPVLAVGDGFCDLTTFNQVVAPLHDAAGAATVFASLAGMPWLGDVEVRDLSVDGDTVSLTTFGGRHAVTSDWTIEVDATGIRRASFTTTDFGLDAVDDIHDLEGITSLPGHTRSWVRDTAGRMQLERSIADDLAAVAADRQAGVERAAELVGRDPGDPLEQTFADGQTIRFTYGVAATPVETVDTGVAQADRLMTLNDGLTALYEDFLDWGISDPWENSGRTAAGIDSGVGDDAGYINIDSGLSAVCLACAFLTDAIEIHMAFVFPDVAPEVVGASYPDREAFFVDVLGHELVHSLQGGYADGGGASRLTNGFVEATARAAEALFDNSANTFQDGSIAYLDNGNGCEGFENGRGGWVAAQAAGPFVDGHTYDSCYFWWTYYAEHGPEGLVRLLEELPATLADSGGQDAPSLNLELLDRASPSGDGTIDLAHWAAAYTAGSAADGYTITGASGVAQDWFSLLTPAMRSQNLGRVPVTADVSNGGTRGFAISRTGTIAQLPAGAEAYVFDVVDGALVLVGPAVTGTPVVAGQLLAVVAPTAGSFGGQVVID